MFRLTPLHPLFAARIDGVDLRARPDAAAAAALRAALQTHSVLVFPGQALDDAAQVSFSEVFGPLETIRAGANGAGGPLIVLTNIGPDARSRRRPTRRC